MNPGKSLVKSIEYDTRDSVRTSVIDFASVNPDKCDENYICPLDYSIKSLYDGNFIWPIDDIIVREIVMYSICGHF